METSSHIVRDIDRGFESRSYDSRDPFLWVTGESGGFIASVGASWWVEDGGEYKRVVGYAEADRAYGAEDSGDGARDGVGGALVVEICC